MEIDKDLGAGLDVKVVLSSGKVQIVIEYSGLDAELDVVKSKLPSYLQPLMDVVKMEVDKP